MPAPDEVNMESSDGVLVKIFEWAWLALVAVIVGCHRKVTGIEARQALLDQNFEHLQQRRKEDSELRDSSRAQLMETIELHNKVVVAKLDTVSERVTAVEKLVKNGH